MSTKQIMKKAIIEEIEKLSKDYVKEIQGFYSKFIKEKRQIFTTDYILDETITLVFRHLD